MQEKQRNQEVNQCDFIPQIIDMIMGIFFPSKNSIIFALNNRTNEIEDAT